MRRFLLIALLASASSAFAGSGRIVIINNDPAGKGFNDPTVVAPVPGNPATTLGQQRLNVFLAAAEKWQSALDTNVDIRVSARFSPIAGCTATQAVLGQASPMLFVFGTPGAPRADIWYPIALANKFAGTDLQPGLDDISVQFNADVDNATCLGDSSWYYGLDANHGNNTDLFVVVLHELAHGLGISGAGRLPEFSGNRPSVFDTHTLDVVAGRRWDQMTPEERRVSLLNTGGVVWDGENVRTVAARYLGPITRLGVTPASPSLDFEIGTAAFGPPPNRTSFSGTVVAAIDAANTDGPTTTDGCSAFANAGAVFGKIALVDRGTCPFVMKARNAQAAGAIGLVIADNVRTTCQPPGLGGNADDITIPVVSITLDNGAALRSQLTANPALTASLRLDGSQLAGTSKEGYVRLYAPCTYEGGSSIHHWDVSADPDLLMEPSVNSGLLHGLDLTLYQLLDIGWSLPPKSGRRILKK